MAKITALASAAAVFLTGTYVLNCHKLVWDYVIDDHLTLLFTQVGTVTDPAYDEQQVQTRITGFLDNWPKLEKWFTKFGILRKVDAALDETSLYLETEFVIEDTLDRVGLIY